MGFAVELSAWTDVLLSSDNPLLVSAYISTVMPNLPRSPPPHRRARQKPLLSENERVTQAVTPSAVTPVTPSGSGFPSANDACEPASNAVSSVSGSADRENKNPNGGNPVIGDGGGEDDCAFKLNSKTSDSETRLTSSAEGMDTGVRKLAEHVFDIWGGRSRTPSMDGVDSEPDKEKCRGGPGKPQCGELVRDGENGIRCDKCHFWYHAACQLIPKTAVTAAGKFPMLHWFCTACHTSIFNVSIEEKSECQKTQDALKSLEKGALNMVTEKVEVLSKSISEHCKLVNRALRQLEEHAVDQTRMLERTVRQQHEDKASYAEIVKSSCSVLTDVVEERLNGLSVINAQLPAHKSPTSRDIQETVSTVLDKERRKLNVVVFNLPESVPADGVTREAKDLNKFKDIIKENLKLIIKASKCYRVGKMQENRPRLLIVSMDDLTSKQELLRMSSQLRQTEQWSKLFINPDQTPAEREAHRQMRQELARRRAAGEQDIGIRKGSIVKLKSGEGLMSKPISSNQAQLSTHPNPSMAQPHQGPSIQPRQQ